MSWKHVFPHLGSTLATHGEFLNSNCYMKQAWRDIIMWIKQSSLLWTIINWKRSLLCSGKLPKPCIPPKKAEIGLKYLSENGDVWMFWHSCDTDHYKISLSSGCFLSVGSKNHTKTNEIIILYFQSTINHNFFFISFILLDKFWFSAIICSISLSIMTSVFIFSMYALVCLLINSWLEDTKLSSWDSSDSCWSLVTEERCVYRV